MGWTGVTADSQSNWADRLNLLEIKHLHRSQAPRLSWLWAENHMLHWYSPWVMGNASTNSRTGPFLMTPLIGSLQDQTHTLLLVQPTCSVQEYSSYAQWALNLQSSQNLIWLLALSKNINVLWIPCCTGEPSLTQMLAVAHFWQLVACSKNTLLWWGARLGPILLAPDARQSPYSQKSTGITHCRKCYLC